MIRANEAKVEWNAAKKQWQVVIQVGGEVISPALSQQTHEAGDADLRNVVVQTANDEGYEVDEANIAVVR